MKSFFAIVLLTVYATGAFTHGEDKPGPHGGFIRMPAAYHTELVTKDDGVLIYLLDISFKNPTIEKSSVEVSLLDTKATATTLSCKAKADHFACALPKGASLKKGSLSVKSTRLGVVSPAPAVYKLPLSHNGADTHGSGHGGH